jgi:3'(2'), 5'-bisphosphate nucleotidase
VLNDLSQLLKAVIPIATGAGDLIMEYFQSGSLKVSKKSDDTPVTTADIAAHELIVSALEQFTDWPILSEEGHIPDFNVRRQWQRYWLIDPLDGTRGFVQGSDEFTVNIALIDQHRPILGVVYAPVFDELYYSCSGQPAYLRTAGADQVISTAETPFEALRFIVGKYHKIKRMQPVLDAIPGAQLLRMNSSLKFLQIACGKADVYPRFGPISEWDTAAAHCVLSSAGGKIVDFNGESLQYNAAESLRCLPFMAMASDTCFERLMVLFNKEEDK